MNKSTNLASFRTIPTFVVASRREGKAGVKSYDGQESQHQKEEENRYNNSPRPQAIQECKKPVASHWGIVTYVLPKIEKRQGNLKGED